MAEDRPVLTAHDDKQLVLPGHSLWTYPGQSAITAA